MKAYLEVVELKNDVITASGDPAECCDYGCGTDYDQINGNY